MGCINHQVCDDQGRWRPNRENKALLVKLGGKMLTKCIHSTPLLRLNTANPGAIYQPKEINLFWSWWITDPSEKSTVYKSPCLVWLSNQSMRMQLAKTAQPMLSCTSLLAFWHCQHAPKSAQTRRKVDIVLFIPFPNKVEWSQNTRLIKVPRNLGKCSYTSHNWSITRCFVKITTVSTDKFDVAIMRLTDSSNWCKCPHKSVTHH